MISTKKDAFNVFTSYGARTKRPDIQTGGFGFGVSMESIVNNSTFIIPCAEMEV